MSNRIMNPIQFKDMILRRLGAPIITIEVTEDHIYDSIARALELYRDYHYGGVNKGYITILINEQQAKSGMFDLSHIPVFSVNKIIRAGNNMNVGLGDGVSTSYFTDFVSQMAGSGVDSLAYHGPFGQSHNVGHYASIDSYLNLLQDQLNPLPNYSFDSTTGMLLVNGQISKGQILVLEVHVETFFDSQTMYGTVGSMGTVGSESTDSLENKWINPYASVPRFAVGEVRQKFPDQGVYNVRWVKDYATCLTKEIWGSILAKHQGMQLLGGTSIDGERIYREAIEEKDKLRQELELLMEPAPVIMG